MELSDQDIINFMISNIPDDAIFHKNPERYIQRRKETEKWLYQSFHALGGTPATIHPIYMTLGASSYIESTGHYNARHEFPLSLFPKSVVSFTYPDSYVSRLLAEKPNEYFNPKFHGKVFTMSELGRLLEDPSVHNEAWRSEKRKYDFFIEAQIWDVQAILKTKAGQVARI